MPENSALEKLIASMRAVADEEASTVDQARAGRILRRSHLSLDEAVLEACFDDATPGVLLRPEDLKQGQIFSKWMIGTPLVRLSSGRPSLLFRAHNPLNISEVVVIKIMMPKNVGNTLPDRRFRKEQAISNTAQHPNIAECLEIGEMKGVPYIVTRLYDQSLHELILHDSKKIVAVGVQVAKGLRYLRDSHGVIHGDLKPRNILIDATNPSKPIPKISDFGGAVRITEHEDNATTEHTPGYIRPYRKGLHLDQRYYSDDTYALVLTLIQKFYEFDMKAAMGNIDPDFCSIAALPKFQKFLNRLAIKLVILGNRVPIKLRWAFVTALTYNQDKSISLDELIKELERELKVES